MPDYAGAVMRAGDEGRRRGMEQRESEARMALLKAQTEAVQPRPGSASQSDKPFDWADVAKSMEAEQGTRAVIYSCDGRQTTYPAVGCMVIGFGD